MKKMTKLTKTLLGLSAVNLAVGFTTDWLWGFGKPAGAILFGLFMISKMLENEMAKFDSEETNRLIHADNVNSADTPANRAEHPREPLRAAA